MSVIPAQEERACHVVLQNVFDGPLDLLLHLVKEQQLDIATVPLAIVADQYFTYITGMSQIDIELAAEYLVIAATLVFLKSRSLLPPIPPEFMQEGEETPEMMEERLRQRLITYSKYREAGESLRQFLFEASAHYYRDGGDAISELRQKYKIVPDKLGLALMAALRAAKEDKRTIVRDRFTVAEQMAYIMNAVRRDGTVLFSSLCAQLDRGGIIATFLATLELIRRGRVGYDQPETFADIRLFAVAPSPVPA
ncbi:MAG: segregation/condensation protein A [Candidatus Eremiobacteraeota bacterium]|nr:segregation/condensation protein A [Candidatus Eremiobacteraeota bacterium]